MSKFTKTAAIVILGLTTLLLVGAFLGRPAYRAFQEKRSLSRARAFADKGDHRNAILSLRFAAGLNPSNVTTAALIAGMLDEAGSPAALTWRRRVAELEPTLTNKLTLAASALRYEKPPYWRAATTLQTMSAEAETNTVYHLLSVQLALALNQPTKAGKHLRSLIRLDPSNPLHSMNLATIHLQSGDVAFTEQACTELLALADHPVLGATALRSLASEALTRKNFADAQRYAARLVAHPLTGLDDRLLQLQVLKEAHAAQFEADLVALHRNSATNPATLAKVITWMNAQGMAKNALDWNRQFPAEFRAAMPVPIAEAESYICLTNFTGLVDHLVRREWGEHEFMRQAFLARALREQGEVIQARRCWRLASGAAASEPGRVSLMLHLARTWGWGHEFRELLWLAADRAYGEEWPLQTLMHEYELLSDTEGLYRVYRALLARNRKVIEYKNNVAALGLLLRTNIAQCVELARECYEAVPTNSTVISTYAFALHTQGKTLQGLKVMQGIQEAELQRPGVALYYGVLLAASGRGGEGEGYLEVGGRGRVLREEKELVEEARREERGGARREEGW